MEVEEATTSSFSKSSDTSLDGIELAEQGELAVGTLNGEKSALFAPLTVN